MGWRTTGRGNARGLPPGLKRQRPLRTGEVTPPATTPPLPSPPPPPLFTCYLCEHERTIKPYGLEVSKTYGPRFTRVEPET